MSSLETEFRSSCRECIEVGINLGIPPAEIIFQLNALLSTYSGKAAHMGLSSDLAADLHRKLVKAISEVVPRIVVYEGPISATEGAILTFFRDQQPARCLPKQAVALGIAETLQPEFQNALLSLYRRGLVIDGDLNLSICLTSAGKGFVDDQPPTAR